MKRFIVLYFMMLSAALALDRQQLHQLLASAASATGTNYLAVRNEIVKRGQDTLPLLGKAVEDVELTWQERLVARICHERIVRGADIEQLRNYDWRKHPQYDKHWEADIVGARAYLGIIAKPVCEQYGLAYYYVEANWKKTKELLIDLWDSRVNEGWPGWCATAVSNQPEHYYLLQARIEQLKNDPQFQQPDSPMCFKYLTVLKIPEAVPILVERLEAYVKRTFPNSYTPQGLDAAVRANLGKHILSFADSRHVELIEKYIAVHPAWATHLDELRYPSSKPNSLASLKEKLEEARKRPAPAPRAEPPFRLGQKPVKP